MTDIVELPPITAPPTHIMESREYIMQSIKDDTHSAIETCTTTIKTLKGKKDTATAAELQKGLAKLRLVSKSIDKLARIDKTKTKRKRAASIDPATGAKKPTGFNRPQRVSPSMAEFLGIGNDTLISRAEVTRQLCKYIREKELQDPGNKRHILPDGPLGTLLGLANDTSDPLTFCKMQSKIQCHMVRANA